MQRAYFAIILIQSFPLPPPCKKHMQVKAEYS